MEVLINGVRYVPAEAQPDEVRFYYMHDNHTFTQLLGDTLDEVLSKADARAKDSPCGMLCPPVLLADNKEVRRLNTRVHTPCVGADESKWVAGKHTWRKECEADSCVMRLVDARNNKGAA